MIIEHLIDLLTENSVLVRLEDGQLSVEAPRGRLTETLVGLLRDNKASLIAYLQAQESFQTREVAVEPIGKCPRAPGAECVPSFGQQRLWFIDQYQGGSSNYNIAMALQVDGLFRPELAEQALRQIVARHEVLRTVYRSTAQGPMQVVRDTVQVSLPVTDLSELDEATQRQRVRQMANEDVRRAFDLESDVMVRGHWLVLSRAAGADRGVLLFNIHHIAADGWSMGVLVREFVEIYRALSAGEQVKLAALPIQYADYAQWQHDYLRGDVLQKQLGYWKDHLAQAPATHGVPLDHPRPAQSAYEGARVVSYLDAVTAQQVMDLAKQQRVTPFMVLHAVLSLLLVRHGGNSDVLIGTPMANRLRVELEPLIGFFANTLVLRSNSSGSETFADYLRHIRQINLDAQANQDVPFDKLVEELAVPRESQYNPLFQIVLSMNTTNKESLYLDGVRFETLKSEAVQAKFDLELTVELYESGMELQWTYDRALFEATTVERLNRHFQRLLSAVVADPDQGLAQIPMLSTEELDYQLYTLNDTDVSVKREGLLHEQFSAMARRYPERTALVSGQNRLSYAEVQHRANQWARSLRARGVGVESLVGVALERSAEMVIAVLAVLKAGAAYVPLDPAYPAERLSFLVEDSGIAWLLTQPSFAERFAGSAARCLMLDELDSALAGDDKAPVEEGQPVSSLAYVIYTSGSTGKPKGVLQTHENVSRLFAVTEAEYGFGAEDVWTLFHSISFDFSVWELWGALLYGGTLVIPDYATTRTPDQFARLCVQEGVTILNQTPSAFGLFSQAVVSAKLALPSLRLVIFGGEMLREETLLPWWEQFGDERPELVNMYGITETTVHVTLKRLRRGTANSQNVGRRLADQALYLLDEQRQPVPLGAVGEVYVGGAGLARGYHNRADLTASRFIDNPYATPAMRMRGETRMYKSGDLARFTPDGELIYIGRNDEQVKIRGFRIELGEVEAHIRAHDAIRQALVLVRQSESMGKTLVAFIVAEHEITEPIADFIERIKQDLAAGLPNYMLPAAFVILPQIPLTVNGKLDTESLLSIDIDQHARPMRRDPRTPREHQIATIWQHYLGREAIGIDENFFSIGGDSILTIQIIAEMKKLGLDLSPRQFFEFPTIAEQALHARTGINLVAETETSSEVRLLPIQQWYFETQREDLNHFNYAGISPAPPGVTEDLLRALLHALLSRHEMLRARFTHDRRQWRCWLAPVCGELVDRSLEVVDLTGLDPSQRRLEIERHADNAQRSLDLEEGPMFKLVWYKCDDTRASDGRMLLIVHHLIIDAVSWRALVEDVSQLTNALTSSAALPDLMGRTSYPQWSERLWQHANSESMLEERNYWLELAGRHAPDFPVDFQTDKRTLADTATLHITLSESETHALLYRCVAHYRASINELLMTALSFGVGEWTGLDRFFVNLEGHGREDLFGGVDVSQTTGWFTTIFPVLLDHAAVPGRGVGPMLASVKQNLRAIPNKGIGYGLLRYLDDDKTLATREAGRRYPILFNYLGQSNDRDEADRTAWEALGALRSSRHQILYPIEINGQTRNGVMSFRLQYLRGEYASSSIERLRDLVLAGARQLIAGCELPRSTVCPADFPLVRLGQNAIDDIARDYSDLEDLYPATDTQKGLVFHSMTSEEPGSYVVQVQLDLRGIDVTLWKRAWLELVQRHAVLRTSFRICDVHGLLQIVSRNATPDWRELDWRRFTAQDRATLRREFITADASMAFDLEKAPMLRLSLIRVDDTGWQFVYTFHHAILDGWSVSILSKELMHLYESMQQGIPAELPPPTPFKLYVEDVLSRDKGKHEAFWRSYLHGFGGNDVPGIRQAYGAHAGETREFSRYLGPEVTSSLVAAAAEFTVTFNTLIQGAWSLLLAQMTGQRDVVFGITTSGRNELRQGLESTVGPLISTVPVRVRIDAALSLSAWLKAIHRDQFDVIEHSASSLGDIHRWSGLARGERLFDSLVVYENFPGNPAALEKNVGNGLDAERLGAKDHSGYPLALTAYPGRDIRLKFGYRSGMMGEQEVRALARNLVDWLKWFASAGAESKLAEISDRYESIVASEAIAPAVAGSVAVPPPSV